MTDTNTSASFEARYIAYLRERFRTDPGLRSRAARDIGKHPESAHGTHKLVAPFLPDGSGPEAASRRRALYTITGWVARHRNRADSTLSLGAALAVACAHGMSERTIESRLAQLVNADWTQAEPRIRRLLELTPVNPDWAQLLRELTQWGRHRDRICAGWLREFYKTASDPEETP